MPRLLIAGEEITSCADGGKQIARSTVATRKLLLTVYAQRHLKSFHFPKKSPYVWSRENWYDINYAIFVFTYLNSCSLALCHGLFHLWPHALAASVYLIVSTGQFHCMLPSNYFNISQNCSKSCWLCHRSKNFIIILSVFL